MGVRNLSFLKPWDEEEDTDTDQNVDSSDPKPMT